MRVALFLFCFGSVTYAYKAHDLVSDLHFSEGALNKMQRTMARLNNIQKELLTGIRSDKTEDEDVSAIFHDKEFNGKPDELPYLFQGDILLTEEQMDEVIANAEDQLWAARGQTNQRKKRSVTSHLYLRWKFPIPYFMHYGIDQRSVLAGINKWQEETCVTFKQMYTPYYRGNGLNFFRGKGCFSFIGANYNSPQQISIGYGCDDLGTVTHEIGHALGFHHEQSRYDRDDYINVLNWNVEEGMLSQFTKEAKSEMIDYGVGYDFGSVMHYGPEGFSANGYNTMESKDKNYQKTFGQRGGPAFSDIKRINLAYCNSSCTTQLDCLNGGYTDPKNCAKCRCPEGFGGILCDRAADANPACGANDLTATNEFQTISAQGGINCPYVITAPPGRKVYFQVNQLQFSHSYQACYSDYLEIKYKEDVVPAGARFCSNYPRIQLSEGNRIVVIYKGNRNTRFTLRFRQDPIGPEEPSTTTTQRPPTNTLRPLTTTEDPKQSTFFPSSSTTPSPTGCSAWSQCTAQCGGCGTTSRRCNGKLETIYCNLDPCEGEHCCPPFFYVKQGKCIRPYHDLSQFDASLRRT